jgi:hypothetical protein
MLKFTLDS